MDWKRKLLTVLLIVVLLGCIIGGLVWHSARYIMIDGKFYLRDAKVLDLRDRDISPALYEKISRNLPECQIRWSIPFQGKTYPDTTDTVTVTALHYEDVSALSYFPALKTVEAEGCTDYENLLLLAKNRPDVEVRYSVSLDGTSYPVTADAIEVSGVTEAELAALPYLPELKSVTVTPGGQTENLSKLQSYCEKNKLSFSLRFGDQTVAVTEKELTLDQSTDGELVLLHLMKDLKKLHLEDPKADPLSVTVLTDAFPGVEITWNKTVWDIPLEKGIETVDLSEGTPGTIEEVEDALAYFPTVTEVFLGKTDIDNEQIAEFRERRREDYKVVWTVGFRNKLFVRSDTKDFFPCHPNRPGLCNFNDKDAANLKYLEEIECMDIGHMPVSKVDFLEYMPHMKYLILSWTQVKEISAVKNCKELIFLEVTDCPLRSLEGVQECTALEDLNFGATWPDVTPLLEMTWLKRVYMIYGNSGDAYKISQALPDATVVASGTATVGGGWRRLQNYYDMRDALGAPYMN